MSTATKIRRSQATFLQFPADRTFTPLEFWHICNCLALQASAGRPDGPLASLQWMLAYWRADTKLGLVARTYTSRGHAIEAVDAHGYHCRIFGGPS